ncbi:ABC transporter ATP-binding protein [Jatrophihabitans fulvus]
MTTRDLLPIAGPRPTAALAMRLLRRRRGALALTVAAFVVAGLSSMVAPLALGRIVDAVRDGDDASTVTRLALVVAAAAVVGGVATTLSAAALARVTAPALADLREDVLDRAVHLDAQRIEAAGAGDVLSRVGDDVRTVTTSLTDVVPPVITSLLTTAFTAVGLLALDWRLGLAGLAAMPCYALALRWYLARSPQLYREERIAQGERAEALVTGIQGAATLRAFARERDQVERVRQQSRRAADLSMTVFGVLVRWGARNNGSELVGLILVLTAGFFVVRSGGTVGEATAAALYFHRLFNPIGTLLFSFDQIQSSGASLSRMAGVALMPPPTADARDRPDAGVVLAGVGHEYVPGRPVLRDVDLVLAPGEHVAVVGATGAGKSTLGLVAAGRVRPTRGRVHAGRVGLVSQDLHVFTGTVADNLTLARPDADDADLRAALARVGALAWVDALPDGAATVVGDGGATLTPAQTQQLALARVLLADPPVVVLDEATAEAGSSGARQLDAAAQAAIEGRTAIVIAHRLGQAAACDRVLLLHDGAIVEQGTHDDLLAAGGRYAGLWTAWSAPAVDRAVP